MVPMYVRTARGIMLTDALFKPNMWAYVPYTGKAVGVLHRLCKGPGLILQRAVPTLRVLRIWRRSEGTRVNCVQRV